MAGALYTRPDWVRRLNAMAGSVGGPEAMVQLDPDELLARARAATGLDDFGDAGWEEPYRRLLVALDTEARFNVVGRLLSRHDVLRHLCTRLLLVDAVRRDPAIAEEQVLAPVFITGPARSGTSILQELLAEDPALRAPLAYEMAQPLPRPGTTIEDRIALAEPEFDLWSDVQPEFAAVHELSARLPEECLWLMAPEFDLGFWATCADIPSFQAWRAGLDATATYRYHRSFLQALQHGHEARPWVLKSPVHLSRLPAIFAVYPDARVIRTHRDPVRVIPSSVSTVALGRWLRSDHVDPREVAVTVGFGMQMLMLIAVEQQASLPAGQVAELQYIDLVRDPVGAITTAYEGLGLPVSPELPDRITGYLANRPQAKFGVHHYDLEAYGLDADQIRRDFAEYVDTFGVIPEDPT
jgi:hypothetical protein